MTLNEYLTNDDNDVTKVFIPLYEKLKVINGNRLRLVDINSKNIISNNNEFDFDNNFELSERGDNSNLITLTKMLLGAYYSKGVNYTDYSESNLNRLIDDLDEMSETIHDDNFDKEYFDRVFNGEIIYYNDYKELKKKDIFTKENKNTNAMLLLVISVVTVTLLMLILLISLL